MLNFGEDEMVHKKSFHFCSYNNLEKPKKFLMLTEFNIYLSLFVAFILLTLSIRLGISLYQSN